MIEIKEALAALDGILRTNGLHMLSMRSLSEIDEAVSLARADRG